MKDISLSLSTQRQTAEILMSLTIHPQKSKIIPLSRGIDFVGFRNFYYYNLLRKRNIIKMESKVRDFNEGKITKEKILESFQGWNAYAMWANSYKLRRNIVKKIYPPTNL